MITHRQLRVFAEVDQMPVWPNSLHNINLSFRVILANISLPNSGESVVRDLTSEESSDMIEYFEKLMS